MPVSSDKFPPACTKLGTVPRVRGVLACCLQRSDLSSLRDMPAPLKQNAIRRSTRLPLEVPVLVTSLDATLEFSEECTTTLVNAHGCGLITQRFLPRGLPVGLEIVRSNRQTTALVADVVPLGGDPETWLLGLEFDKPGNFWGIEYAPSDWKIDIDETPAAAPTPARPQSASAAKPAPTTRRWRLTDISAGACYLEVLEPFPVDVLVLISVRVASTEWILDGIVRASHPQTGMGIEFTSRSGDHGARVEELVSSLVESREVPRVFVGRKEDKPAAHTASQRSKLQRADAETPDPLLDLVRRGDSLPIEEFLDALKTQRQGQK
jgi:hypothetical protein